MCGIVGVSLGSLQYDAYSDLLETAAFLQHRGQDACGIICGTEDGTASFHRGAGLVNEVFGKGSHVASHLQGSFGIVRYPTNGEYNKVQIQPIIDKSRGNIAIAHNGNLENSRALGTYLTSIGQNQSNCTSDSGLILETLLSKYHPPSEMSSVESWIMLGLEQVYLRCVGSFACVLFIPGYGLVAFRDANGIKPVIMAERILDHGEVDYMFASESVACTSLGYTPVRDVRPGEAIFVPYASACRPQHRCIIRQVVPQLSYSPDIFEYVYFARADSVIDGISVNRSRRFMGKALAQTLINEITAKDGCVHEEIDCVIPVPETSLTCALAVSQYLHKPLAFGFVRNRFIFRTFLLPTQKQRTKAVASKLSTVREEFEGRNVLIIDDSIVRGTTAIQIVKMAREAGAKKVYFASGSPAIRFKHIHGIDLADESRLIAHGRSNLQISEALGADGVFYLSLDALIDSCISARRYGDVSSFEVGIFNGVYSTRGSCLAK
ncbi:hypothetical protein JX265_005358 [Neoarthrinium moseri]|uniref:Amidophosphoribosyltransferase n=1 Tax=Neoarthrinium moseri TaxID=1658444 RepID=A0A9Q0ARQ8_9PEZI|nr:uncharacterized protein JN550_006185 [Neoarthrinium moseri]KAI1845668.1 hypothetical protein JX266_008279 [Neoarthrinium moseri]KAI1868610.1 hypothetical protein JN550_006185 [Neoarthrinium moseri]KAI1872478.1 hypothetical protein JX265_005358 [Neoarthrinium moseri]